MTRSKEGTTWLEQASIWSEKPFVGMCGVARGSQLLQWYERILLRDCVMRFVRVSVFGCMSFGFSCFIWICVVACAYSSKPVKKERKGEWLCLKGITDWMISFPWLKLKGVLDILAHSLSSKINLTRTRHHFIAVFITTVYPQQRNHPLISINPPPHVASLLPQRLIPPQWVILNPAIRNPLFPTTPILPPSLPFFFSHSF